MPLKVGINFMGSDVRLGPRFERVLALAREADERGIDMLTFPDHLAIGLSAFEQPLHFGETFPFPRDMAWYEPVTALAALAAVTRTGAPLGECAGGAFAPGAVHRQTGRDPGRDFGRSSLPRHGRRLARGGVRSVRGCPAGSLRATRGADRGLPGALGRGSCELRRPDGADSRTCTPCRCRCRAGRYRSTLALPATGRHVERIARLADGWSWGYVGDPPLIAEGLARIREAMARLGRSPTNFEVKAFPLPIHRADGSVDLEATFARVPPLVEAGVTIIEPNLHDYCSSEADIPHLLDHLNALQRQFAQ